MLLKWNNILQTKYFNSECMFCFYSPDIFLQNFTPCKVRPLDAHHPVECTGTRELRSSVSLPKMFLLICGQFLHQLLFVSHLSLLAIYHILYLLVIPMEKSLEQFWWMRRHHCILCNMFCSKQLDLLTLTSSWHLEAVKLSLEDFHSYMWLERI